MFVRDRGHPIVLVEFEIQQPALRAEPTNVARPIAIDVQQRGAFVALDAEEGSLLQPRRVLALRKHQLDAIFSLQTPVLPGPLECRVFEVPTDCRVVYAAL